MKKVVKIVLGCLAVVIAIPVLWCLYFFFPLPFKSVDPYHPWFNPDQFRFNDYMGSKCMEKEILAKLFPPGTDKAFVDRVLVKAGGASIKESSHEHNKFNYYYDLQHMDSVWNVAVRYDLTNKVIDVRIPGGEDEIVYNFYQVCQQGRDYGRNWK